MVKRWLRYLAVWISCLIFYFAYRQWMAWIILMSVSLLPLLSLALGVGISFVNCCSYPISHSAHCGFILPPFP